jgi:hypothetical protein
VLKTPLDGGALGGKRSRVADIDNIPNILFHPQVQNSDIPIVAEVLSTTQFDYDGFLKDLSLFELQDLVY